MAHLAVVERHALAETLRSVPPDSPTLCGDWTAAQLAAHLVLRERSIVEMSGRIPVPALQRRAERALADYAPRQPHERLVDAGDARPPRPDPGGAGAPGRGRAVPAGG